MLRAPLLLVATLAGCLPGPLPVERRVDDLASQHGVSLQLGALTALAEDLDDAVFVALLADPRVTRLTDLGLADNRLGPAAVEALLASPKSEGLRALDLGGNPIGDRGVGALAASPRLATVETLLLTRVGAGAAGLGALAASPNARALRQLDVSGNTLGDAGGAALASLPVAAWLSAEDAGIGGAGARALVASTPAPRLSLAGNPIGLGGLGGLDAISPALADLSLARTRVGPGDALTLAALDAPGLARLDLRGNALGDEGVRALARASWFVRLTHLDVSDTGASGATYTALQAAWGTRGGLTAR